MIAPFFGRIAAAPYGSRRTYLRKVALADFEGITANTTFVLRTKDPAQLLPELLPFLMQTEAFHSYSIKHSKGSVTPRAGCRMSIFRSSKRASAASTCRAFWESCSAPYF